MWYLGLVWYLSVSNPDLCRLSNFDSKCSPIIILNLDILFLLHSAASDLVLHCLPGSHEKDARLKWVKGRSGVRKNNLSFGTFCLALTL